MIASSVLYTLGMARDRLLPGTDTTHLPILIPLSADDPLGCHYPPHRGH